MALMGTSVPGLAADVHAPAANTAAIVTYAAVAGQTHIIGQVVCSYNATPTGGNLKIEDVAGTVIFSVDIPAAGVFVIPFYVPKRGAAQNTAMIVTLAAGGASATGKLSCTHWTEP